MGIQTYDHIPTPIGLAYNVVRLPNPEYDCVDGAAIVGETSAPVEDCRTAGDLIPRAGTRWFVSESAESPRVVGVIGVDELPDLAACFYRVHVDVEVRHGGSFPSFGP